MLMNNRIVWGDNGALKDLSVNLNSFKGGTSSIIPFVAAEDFLYFASELPFNHRWFEIDVFNALASTLTIQIWDGDTWNEAVDIIDQTDIGGKPFAQSGIISWTLDKTDNWGKEDTVDSNGEEDIEGLGGVKIYNLYWVRFKFSADLTAGLSLKHVGHKFSDETDLSFQYPDLILSAAKVQFQLGKTDWRDQEFLAAAEIIRYLKAKGILETKDQILNWELFTMASVHKIADIIYRGFGNDFVDDRESAIEDFKEAMDQEIFQVDENRNARLDDAERFKNSGLLVR